MRSTKRSTSAQAPSQVPLVTPHYIATSGVDLVEVASSLVFIQQAALDYVRLNGEDVAIWHITPEYPPRLCNFIRPLVNGGAALHQV